MMTVRTLLRCRCFTSLLKMLLRVCGLYLLLFTGRFLQLNFCGREIRCAELIPEALPGSVVHDFPEAYENREHYPVSVQCVDLDWNPEPDFILYENGMILVYSRDCNRERVCMAGADSLTRLLCLPVRVSGCPLVLRFEACHDRKAWQIVSLPQGERM